MKVDTMRRIDYWFGVPLCALASGLLRLRRLLPRRTARDERPRRVCFIELSEMGSAILVDPAMRRMEQEGAELYFCIFHKNAPSLGLLGTVPSGNVFTIRGDRLMPLLADSLRFFRWTRERGIDTVIDLELFSRYTALLTGLSGARRRVGFHSFHQEGLYRGDMLTRRVAYNPHMHIAKNFMALVHAAGSEQEECPFSKVRITDEAIRLVRAEVSEARRAALHERVREAWPEYRPGSLRLVLINPNASELLTQRRWMPEYYEELVRRLLVRFEDVLVLITGSPAERDEAEALRRAVDHPRCVNFAGRVRLEDLPALYAIARLMVSNDSGPAHFSAVTSLRTFVLFGPETPHLYGFLGNSVPIYAGLACSPCVSAANHRKTPCRDNVCLRVITPERVYALVSAELEKGLAQSDAAGVTP